PLSRKRKRKESESSTTTPVRKKRKLEQRISPEFFSPPSQKMVTMIKNRPDVLTPQAERLVGKFRNFYQEPSNRECIFVMPRTDDFPLEILGNIKGLMFISPGKNRAGSESDIRCGPFYTKTDTSKHMTFKIAKDPSVDYKVQKVITDRVFSGNTKNVDCSLGVFMLGDRQVSVHNYFPKDFWEHDFNAKSLIESFIQVLKPLEILHEKGSIHRDIKPLNLLIDSNKSVITDFGFCCQPSTKPKGIAGTPLYLNPRSFGDAISSLRNQRKFQGIQRPCDDLYAIGVSIFQLLAKSLNIHTETVFDFTFSDNHKPLETIDLELYGQLFPDQLTYFSSKHLGGLEEKNVYEPLFENAMEIAPHRDLIKPLLILSRELIDSSDEKRDTASQFRQKLEGLLSNRGQEPKNNVSKTLFDDLTL
ncbi:MAG: hypothetical protein K1060chlam2_00732, partial [Chlamydiae bacterium]|nr:hypothetical protein [Chlamydiota bacterium]